MDVIDLFLGLFPCLSFFILFFNNINYFQKECGLQVDAKDKDGFSLLHYALTSNDPSFIESLVKKHSLSINIQSSSLYSPLLLASLANNADTIQTLLNLGANIEMFDYHKQTPLRHAVSANNMEALHTLINNNANIGAIDCNNNTPLLLALLSSNHNMVEELCKKGALNVEEDSGFNCLLVAVKNEDIMSLEVLKRYGVDMNLTGNGG